MRIAFVVHGYPPREAAGVELVAKEQAEALAARGHRVHVFARGYAHAGDRPGVTDGIEGPIPVRRFTPEPGVAAGFRDAWEGEDFSAPFADFLREARPDVVHVQHLVLLSTRLLEVARDAGVPIVLSLHDAFYLCHRLFLLDASGARCAGPEAGARCEPCLDELGGRDSARARFDAMAVALHAVDAIVAPSRALAARYETEMPFLHGRIEVIDPGMAAEVRRVPRADRSDGRLRLLFVGTWLPHKGLDLLVDAVSVLDPSTYRLEIRGSGVLGREDYVDRLRERTRDLPVEWAPPFGADRLEEVLSAADVLVLPSRCDESYSRVVREARMAGLAVVAPATGGPGEILSDGVDAILVEPGSRLALETALRRLVGDRALVERLAGPAAAFPRVADAAARLEELYDRVAARPAPSPAGVRVTVAYVTKNGAEFLGESLAAVRAQRGAADLVEILAVDSGSTDGTLEILARHGARVLRIAPEEFGHGRTRNLAARAAVGDVVVFLTQDATPANADWLARLVAPLARDPLIAGTWSRHRARPGCHPMEWRKVEDFEPFHGPDLQITSARGNPEFAGDPDRFCWFSNNASAIRREVLERFPFPEVGFAEDQAWARQVLEAGFRTALVNDSCVLHSHAYTPWSSFRRYFDHARAMTLELGRRDDLTLRECLGGAWRETGRDLDRWAVHTGRGRTLVAARWALPALTFHLGAFTGRWVGARAGRLPAVLSRRFSLQEHLRAAR